MIGVASGRFAIFPAVFATAVKFRWANDFRDLASGCYHMALGTWWFFLFLF
jgi:hypothetical protein